MSIPVLMICLTAPSAPQRPMLDEAITLREPSFPIQVLS
jgi:hypothetical protein